MSLVNDDNGLVLNTVDPAAVKRIHLVGIGGTGMGSFAGLLKACGHEVTGSDENVYPPMSDMLKKWGITALTPYSPHNLDAAKPDLVIMGNVIRRINVEATAVRERRLPHMSFPAALGSFFLKARHSMVVAGTHGKTTTSSMLGHVLAVAGKDPSFLVGGVAQNSGGNFKLGQGEHFVIEGDEYDTAYFDKGPKFLHYQPQTLILTSIEFDHADIYRDLAHYEASFEKLVQLVPSTGTIVVSAGWPNAVRIARSARSSVVTYSAQEQSDADLRPISLSLGPHGSHFGVSLKGQPVGEFHLPMAGVHNVENALGVLGAAMSVGLTAGQVAQGLETFQGVKRRQEVRGEPRGVLVIDDFAHHPTAVRETIAGIAARYPGRRLWAIFEPRSNTSRRNIHQSEYARSFTGAHRALFKIPERHDKIPDGEGLDVPRLARELSASGVAAAAMASIPEMLECLVKEASAGDVMLVMSNGNFGGLIESLLQRLSAP
jgi:UDP-N-acetylmuramate: L-alanyl-gamma-D-glutamyl-meso-diaminopimelate ligase